MKPQEKRMIAILVVITLVVIALFIFTKNKNDGGSSLFGKTDSSVTSKEEAEDKYVTELSDGTRKNTSKKVQETKKAGGLELSEIQLTEKDNVTLILGTVKNTSSSTNGNCSLEVTLVDENGETLYTTDFYVKPLEPGETAQLNVSATVDGANAYDLKIAVK